MTHFCPVGDPSWQVKTIAAREDGQISLCPELAQEHGEHHSLSPSFFFLLFFLDGTRLATAYTAITGPRSCSPISGEIFRVLLHFSDDVGQPRIKFN